MGTSLAATALFHGSQALAGELGEKIGLPHVSDGQIVFGAIMAILLSKYSLVVALLRSEKKRAALQFDTSYFATRATSTEHPTTEEHFNPVRCKSEALLKNCQEHGTRSLYFFIQCHPHDINVLEYFLELTVNSDFIDIVLQYLSQIDSKRTSEIC